MRTIYLKEFIKTGKFGTLEINFSTRDDILNLMGDGYDHGDFGTTQIIKYAWYEFFYNSEDKLLTGIQNDHLQYDCSNHEDMFMFENSIVRIDPWILKPNENVTFIEVIEHLEKDGVKFKISRHGYVGALDYIELDNGVTLDFDDELTLFNKTSAGFETKTIDERNNFILNGIRNFAK